MKISFTILSICLALTFKATSQHNIDALCMDSLLSKEVHAFLQEQGIELHLDSLMMKELNILIEQYGDGQMIHPIKTSVYIDNYLSRGDSTLQANYSSNLYTNIGFNTSTSIVNIPFTIRGNLVLDELQVYEDLSTVTFQFDYHQALSQLKGKYIPKHTLNDFWNKAKNPLKLDEIELQVLRKRVKYELYRKLIIHPKFIVFRKNLYQRIDSLQEDLGTTLKLNDIERQSLDIIKTIETQYKQLVDYQQGTEDPAISIIHTKLKAYLQEREGHEVVDLLKTRLSKEKLSSLERLMLFTKDFSLGFSSLNESDFTVRHTTLNGIQYAYEEERVYGKVAYGKQGLPYPITGVQFFQEKNHRKYLYAKAGIQSAKEQIELSILQVQDSLSNRVVRLAGEVGVSETQALNIEAALSDYESLEQQVFSASHSALSASWKLSPKDASIDLALGYFRVGADFVTLGNPFLLTNKQGANLDVKGELFNKKLRVHVNGRIGRTIDETRQSKTRDWQFLGEASYRFGKQNMISARVMPNILYQGKYEDRLQAQQTIYSLQANVVHEIGKGQLLSIAQLSNIRSGFGWIDSVQVAQTVYAYIQESYVFSSDNQLALAAQFGTEDALLQLDYQWVIRQKGNLLLGAQWTNQLGIEQYGIVAGIQYQLNDKLDVQCNLTKRIGDAKEFFGNTMLQMQF